MTGADLKTRRRVLGLSREQLAALCETTGRTIMAYERNESARPHRAIVAYVEQVLTELERGEQ